MQNSNIKAKIKSALEQSSYTASPDMDKTIDRLTEELSIYHMELVHQNEELERTQLELNRAKNKYKDLFEHAPVGYVIYDFEGRIYECNSTFLLMTEQNILAVQHSNITQWIAPESQDQFYFFNNQLKRSNDAQYCEVQLNTPAKETFVAVYSKVEQSNEKNMIRSAFIDISLQRVQRQEIEYLSFHDQLTGLHNRHFLNEQKKHLSTLRNYPMSLVMIDVDGLKLVNDAFGHKAGDSVLIKVAQCLKESLTPDTTILRWGGDEFLVLLPNTTYQETKELVPILDLQMRNKLKEPIESSTSFGYAEINEDISGFEEAFRLAEKMMYKQKLFNLKSKRREIIDAIMATLHEKNPREAVHSRNVHEFAMEFGNVLGLSEETMKLLDLASLFHDIGKISIDYSILNKPSSLTIEEYEEIKHHPEAGYRILSMIPDFSDVADIVRHHHERFDGNGYPSGLKGNNIPYLDRIILIADAFDAIVNDRPYRKKQTIPSAIKILEENKAQQFDPELVEIFIQKVIPNFTAKNLIYE